MPNVTVYLPDEQHKFLKASRLSPSELLREAIQDLQLAPLEQKFREELEKYRSSPDRKTEWEEQAEAADGPFRQCETCGTWTNEFEGCMAMAEPYDAAPVALLAHYPDDMRRANLRYWADSGFKDVTMGMPND